MNDIQNQADLYLLVDEFYKKLLSDDAINYIFTDVVKIKIEEHLPVLVTFWSQAILALAHAPRQAASLGARIPRNAADFPACATAVENSWFVFRFNRFYFLMNCCVNVPELVLKVAK